MRHLSQLLKTVGLLFFIFWTYHPEPWTFGPLNMTAGWFKGFTTTDRETCERGREAAWQGWSSYPGLKTKCLRDNVVPEPIAEMIR